MVNLSHRFVLLLEVVFISFLKDIKKYTIVATIFSLFLAVFYVWWFTVPIYFFGIYLLFSLLFSVPSIPFLYRLFGFRAKDELQWLISREKKEHQSILDKLATIQERLALVKHKDGLHQVKVLSNIVDDYYSVVETRFLGSDQAPESYMSAARTVQKNALQNLADIVAVAHSINTIKGNKLDSSAINTDEVRERQLKRDLLLSEQESRNIALIEENRKIFNALMDTAVEVANIKSFSDYQRTDTLTRLIALSEVARQSKSRLI